MRRIEARLLRKGIEVIILDIAAAFAIAILCGLGGGGGIFVLYLTAVSGMKQITAQGVNLLFFLSSAVGAFAVNRKNKLIDLKTFAIISIGGIPMAVLGSLAASLIKNALLSKMYGGLLVLSGLYYLFQKEKT